MTEHNQHPQDDRLDEAAADTAKPQIKKPFVEPAISNPIDVLEATTFFQAVDSGATTRPRD